MLSNLRKFDIFDIISNICSGIDFGLDVKTISGKNIITEIDNFVNKTLRVKFPKEVEKILNEKVISDKKKHQP
jgi:protein associated with RNAse G/E